MARSQLWVNVAYGELLADAKPGTVIDKDSVQAKAWDCLINQVETARDFWRNPYFNFTSNPLNHTWKVTFVPRDSQRRDFNVALAYQKILLEQEQLPASIPTNGADTPMDYEQLAATMPEDELKQLLEQYRAAFKQELMNYPRPTNRKEYKKAVAVCSEAVMVDHPLLVAGNLAYSALRTDVSGGHTPKFVKPVTPLQVIGKSLINIKGEVIRWSGLGQTFGKNRGKGKSKSINALNLESAPEKSKTVLSDMTQRYIDISANFQYLPTDTFLAHIWGCVGSTMHNARAAAIQAGYSYKQLDGGWQVISRPQPYEALSLDELLKEFANQVKAQGKASDALTDFMRSKGML